MFKPEEKIHSKTIAQLESYFTSLFDKLAIKHSYYNVFDHFLDCAINGFCFNYDNEIMDHIRKRYTQDERYMFGEMIKVWILLADRHVTDNSTFYDFFGNYYEQQSMSKQKGFAQYFTPESICFLMTSLVFDKGRESVYEPTCGSGRLNLAAHSVNNKCFHYANDLDLTCAKMATLNFMLHGIKGVVTCDDALLPNSKFKGAFIINDKFVPSITYTNNSKFVYNYIASKIKETDRTSETKEAITEAKDDDLKLVSKVYKKSALSGQLSLFE